MTGFKTEFVAVVLTGFMTVFMTGFKTEFVTRVLTGVMMVFIREDREPLHTES